MRASSSAVALQPGRHADCPAARVCCMQSASKAAETASTQQPTSPLLTSLDSSLSSAVAAAAEHLAEHGWAVVLGVLSKVECQQYEQGVWGWLGRLSGGSVRCAACASMLCTYTHVQVSCQLWKCTPSHHTFTAAAVSPELLERSTLHACCARIAHIDA